MKYSIEIILDDKVKEPFMIIERDLESPDGVKTTLYISTNDKIDFKKIRMFSIGDDELIDTFKEEFRYGKGILENAFLITVKPKIVEKERNEKIMQKYLDEIHHFLENNKRLSENSLLIGVGTYNYDDENVKFIEQFKNYEKAFFVMSNLNDLFTADTILKQINIVSNIEKEIKKHPKLSPLEQSMYAYDLLRTNMAKTLENDTEEEKEFNKFADKFMEPSFFYAPLYTEILRRLNIASITGTGYFNNYETRKYTIAYIIDRKYNIEGVYYFDPGINSKIAMENSLEIYDSEEDNSILSTLKNYSGFAKTKGDIEFSGYLDFDFIFADFDHGYINDLENIENGIITEDLNLLTMKLNNISMFIDKTNIICDTNIFYDSEAVSNIKIDVERYDRLFDNEIDANKFLEILFNVRRVEYLHNSNIFRLSTDELKDILYNSDVAFKNTSIELDVKDTLALSKEETKRMETRMKSEMENNFENFTTKHDISNKIKKLKLSHPTKDEKERKDKNN